MICFIRNKNLKGYIPFTNKLNGVTVNSLNVRYKVQLLNLPVNWVILIKINTLG